MACSSLRGRSMRSPHRHVGCVVSAMCILTSASVANSATVPSRPHIVQPEEDRPYNSTTHVRSSSEYLQLHPGRTAGGGGPGSTPVGGAPTDARFTVNFLHINDHHSFIGGVGIRFKSPSSGMMLRTRAGGYPRLIAMLDMLDANMSNVVRLHAGDALVGSFWFADYGKGRADAEVMKWACFDAFEIGNHEFDKGDTVLKRFLDLLEQGTVETCNKSLSILGANIQPAVTSALCVHA